MPSPSTPHEAGTWFPDRVENAKTRRHLKRLYAIGFNALFLSLIGFGRLGVFVCGVVMMFLAKHYQERPTQGRYLATEALDKGDDAVTEPVRLEIYRGDVLLGVDEGWVGRRNGALGFEGRRTRFDIVKDDLEFLPRPRSMQDKPQLKVSSHQGLLDVVILPRGTHDVSRTRIPALLVDWPEAERNLPGPPDGPDPRRPYEHLLRQAMGRSMFLLPVVAFLALMVGAMTESAEIAGMFCLIASTVIGGLNFCLHAHWDRKALMHLAAEDARIARLRASSAAPIEPSAATSVETVVR